MEKHSGDWRTCARCSANVETEMYVCYGTNQYNFEKLSNPPAYEPTRCTKCNDVIVLSEGGYSVGDKGYTSDQCSGIDWMSALGGG